MDVKLNLIEIDRKYSHSTPETEGAKSRQDCGGSDGKNHEVGEGGDRDGHSCPAHRQCHPRGNVRGTPLFWGKIVVALHDYEHVIDADAQEEERDDVVHRAVEQADGGTDAVAEADGHSNGSETRPSQHRPLVHAVKSAQHECDIDEDDDEADGHHDGVISDCVGGNVRVTSGHINVTGETERQGCPGKGRGVKYIEMLKDEPVIKKEISQGLFPFKGCLINHLPGSQAMGWQK